MSRKTFADLIHAYGAAERDFGFAPSDDNDGEGLRACEAREALIRALRKAGIPLNQVAPQ